MKSTVFIDIDTQYDFMKSQGRLYVRGAQDIIPRIKALTKAASDRGVLIISSMDCHSGNDPEFRAFPPHCLRNTPGWKKLPESLLKEHLFVSRNIIPMKQLFRKIKGRAQVLLEKNTYDIFTNFNILKLLKPFNRAVVYGVALDYCVKYAVLGLLQSGLEVELVVDAQKAVNPGMEAVILKSFRDNGVRLIKTEKALSQIGSLKE